eukprot:1864438-Rhodomonas_salina.1
MPWLGQRTNGLASANGRRRPARLDRPQTGQRSATEIGANGERGESGARRAVGGGRRRTSRLVPCWLARRMPSTRTLSFLRTSEIAHPLAPFLAVRPT